jgi:hypothetical protein
VYESIATNLVPRTTDGSIDIIATLLPNLESVRVSADRRGKPGNGDSSLGDLSDTGRYVVFSSLATNFVPNDRNGRARRVRGEDIFVKDLLTGRIQRVNVDRRGKEANDGSSAPILTPDGSVTGYISAATNLVRNDTNQAIDVFVSRVPRPNRR